MKESEIQNATVFRGRFKECVAHLFAELESRAPKGTREATALRRPIAEFCGIQECAVTRWMRGESGAIGETMLRFICYLQMIGYEVTEFDRADPLVQSTIEIIGFRIMSGKEVADAIGYTTASTLFQALGGHAGFSDERKSLLWSLAKKHRNDLEEAKAKARDAMKTAQARRSHEPEGPSPNQDATEKKRVITDIRPLPVGTGHGVVGIMGGLLILLERGALTEDDCSVLTPQEQGTILKLSGHLSRLSSKLISGNAER